LLRSSAAATAWEWKRVRRRQRAFLLRGRGVAVEARRPCVVVGRRHAVRGSAGAGSVCSAAWFCARRL